MSKAVARNQGQRELLKIYDDLCYTRSRWEVWQDMVIIIATAISNSVDAKRYEEREKLYLERIGKYKPDAQRNFVSLFNKIICILDDNPFQDLLGDLFMLLGLGNDAGGQFFTPYSVCQMMGKMVVVSSNCKDEIKRKGYFSVNDCACGAGATLIGAAEALYLEKINYQQTALFIAQDIDYTTALMCYIQLSLLGCAGYVRIGDSLSNPLTGDVLFGEGSSNVWYTPMYFSETWHDRRKIAAMKKIIDSTAHKTIALRDNNEPFYDTPSETLVLPPEKPSTPILEEQEPVKVIEVTAANKRRQAQGQLAFDI